MTREDTYYNASLARDVRFDGVFFMGVTSTGIYCRPICPAKKPKPDNCRFFDSAEAAEKAAFRPCLRCRPELAPGLAPIDDAGRIASLIAHRLEEGTIAGDSGLEDIADQFDLSARQIRRIVQAELGVSPIELIQTRRLLLAKQLLTETRLPVTEIAFASGFSSLRQFNDAFQKHYALTPSALRKTAGSSDSASSADSDSLSLQLSYRPPYDWEGLLAFLKGRVMTGVDLVTDHSYARTIELGGHTGWVRVQNAAHKNALTVDIAPSLLPVLPALLGRLKNLFDLQARPDIIAARLSEDALLKAWVEANPGQRVPGAFDGFEMTMRAILGQQVTVKAATTLSCRFAEAFGAPVTTPIEGLTRLSPRPERIAAATVDDIARLGIISSRAKSMIAIAQKVSSGELSLEAGIKPETVVAQLTTIPGIGPWTAHYIAMRALRWPDAFPKEDIAVLNNLSRDLPKRLTPKQAEAASQNWRPWRAYAVMHIWNRPQFK
ncbi:AlkA N-terminal domain-containing protein [Asticcacaulis sp. ZE23SCel15]|uniref:DNA-3-methyladenine glycosylase 2 family protein n=1 Tax=Asticcacaulis sp. ZE23SCel15 TaxID=3059027 RepID=UPI002660401F|nr:DNA-3-methyladenine glycosylase 2 family protein [Asticcacaulis sp. ZE23SCel15]WKL58815.1 AlkA N-terminal domain-containing protein [Asticcacaulis sp. ZE23SCel15]